MKKWYFSKNGEISGPMDLSSARKSVEKSTDLYGWHPSFSTWKPVGMIGEFADLVPDNKATNQVPDEIINEFNQKKSALLKNLSLINENIKETEILKAKLKKKITLYRHLTEDLNEEVQSAIVSVEEQYTTFKTQLIKLEETAKIASAEIDQVNEQFTQLIASKRDGKEAQGSAEATELIREI